MLTGGTEQAAESVLIPSCPVIFSCFTIACGASDQGEWGGDPGACF